MHRKWWLAGTFTFALFGFVLVILQGNSGARVPDVNDALEDMVPREDKDYRADGTLKLPKASIAETSFDFGTMDPLTEGRHTFVIHNRGDAPLKLHQGPTSCKCTIGNVANGEVAPGEYGEVVLDWNTGRNTTEYSHSALVFTNDPFNRSIELRINGNVLAQLAAQPPRLVFSRVVPETIAVASTIIYSQTWESFNLDQYTCSLEGATVTAEPLDEWVCRKLNAKSAQQVTVTLPDDLRPGELNATLKFTPADRPGSSVDVLLEGRVVRRLAVYGEAILTNGTIEMGRLPLRGEPVDLTLLLKVRDSQKQLKLISTKVQPSFVGVRVEPYKPQVGLYHLRVHIPADRQRFRPKPGQTGELQLKFDHPRIQELSLRLDLIVDHAGAAEL